MDRADADHPEPLVRIAGVNVEDIGGAQKITVAVENRGYLPTNITEQALKVVIPLTLLIIFVLIYLNTGSVAKTAIVLLAVPFSAIGAIRFSFRRFGQIFLSELAIVVFMLFIVLLFGVTSLGARQAVAAEGGVGPRAALRLAAVSRGAVLGEPAHHHRHPDHPARLNLKLQVITETAAERADHITDQHTVALPGLP